MVCGPWGKSPGIRTPRGNRTQILFFPDSFRHTRGFELLEYMDSRESNVDEFCPVF